MINNVVAVACPLPYELTDVTEAPAAGTDLYGSKASFQVGNI
jgi:hypothetical protein